MQAILEVMSGPLLGKQVRLTPGEVLQVGRSSEAGLSVPYDSGLADIHFTLQYVDQACRIRPRNNTVVLLNGQSTGLAPLQDGDQVLAGETRFLFRFGVGRQTGAMKLSQALLGHSEPAFAILDASRDPEILDLVRAHPDLCQSLLDDEDAEKFAAQGPYLVTLQPGRLLTLIADLGWNKDWGIFLTCPLPVDEVREHLRSLLGAETEDGTVVFFRYYDPDIFRSFLPTCTGPVAKEFFGPITRFFVAGESASELIQYTPRDSGVARAPLTVARG